MSNNDQLSQKEFIKLQAMQKVEEKIDFYINGILHKKCTVTRCQNQACINDIYCSLHGGNTISRYLPQIHKETTKLVLLNLIKETVPILSAELSSKITQLLSRIALEGKKEIN
jgi:hypothetical protein